MKASYIVHFSICFLLQPIILMKFIVSVLFSRKDKEVAVVYYRIGYMPENYDPEVCHFIYHQKSLYKIMRIFMFCSLSHIKAKNIYVFAFITHLHFNAYVNNFSFL